MPSADPSIEHRVDRAYTQAHGDPSFSEVASATRIDLRDDDQAAELIEVDGRTRISMGLFVDLGRYLETVPMLQDRAVPLDAAIDVTLRSLSGSHKPTHEAVDTLLANYPHLGAAIEEAASLAEAICSTSTLRRSLTEPPRAVPSDFGPSLASGQARFELRTLLGSGSWGQVYLAHDRLLSDDAHEAMVAVKIPVFGAAAEAERIRFVEEAAKARRVVHPNVVRVLDRGVSIGGEDYIVYEYVEAGSLAAHVDVKGGRLDAKDAAALVAQIARGVHAAHLAGLVHCDLKPSNILLTPLGQPKVADFGIAVRRDFLEEAEAALSGERAGNIAFAAPEQYRMEEGALAIPADIYALGGILYYLVTGEFPNGGTAEAIAHTHDPVDGRTTPPSARATRPELDADLDRICGRCMGAMVGDRCASAAALAEDLEAWLAREPIAWTRPSMLRRTKLWCSRKRGLAIAIAVGGAAALALGAFGAYQAVNAAKAWHESALSDARLEGARKRVGAELNNMLWLKSSGFDNQMPTLLLGWDSVGGSGHLALSETRTKLWKDRQTIARQRVEGRAARGQADSLDALLWQSGLGLWLLNDGKAAEAVPVLEENLRRWKTRLEPKDPWLMQLDLVATAAHAEMEMAEPGQASDERRTRWEELAAKLQSEKAVFGKLDEQCAGRKAVLRTLIHLYDKDHLDRRAEHRRTKAVLDDIQ